MVAAAWRHLAPNYCVTDGTRKTPRGHVGYADTRAEALALRAEKCHMGGYITRERVTTAK